MEMTMSSHGSFLPKLFEDFLVLQSLFPVELIKDIALYFLPFLPEGKVDGKGRIDIFDRMIVNP
jgi:hypothetical protein